MTNFFGKAIKSKNTNLHLNKFRLSNAEVLSIVTKEATLYEDALLRFYKKKQSKINNDTKEDKSLIKEAFLEALITRTYTDSVIGYSDCKKDSNEEILRDEIKKILKTLDVELLIKNIKNNTIQYFDEELGFKPDETSFVLDELKNELGTSEFIKFFKFDEFPMRFRHQIAFKTIADTIVEQKILINGLEDHFNKCYQYIDDFIKEKRLSAKGFFIDLSNLKAIKEINILSKNNEITKAIKTIKENKKNCSWSFL